MDVDYRYVKNKGRLLDSVILPTIATDCTHHLCLLWPRPFPPGGSVFDIANCEKGSIKPVLVQGGSTSRRTKSCLCCRCGFLPASNVTDRTRTWYMTFHYWWESGQEPRGGHLAVTMVMICRSQLFMGAQIHTTCQGTSGLARLGHVSDLALKQSWGHAKKA